MLKTGSKLPTGQLSKKPKALVVLNRELESQELGPGTELKLAQVKVTVTYAKWPCG
jgi:hypothetical protein